jgi:hypothetical protein
MPPDFAEVTVIVAIVGLPKSMLKKYPMLRSLPDGFMEFHFTVTSA